MDVAELADRVHAATAKVSNHRTQQALDAYRAGLRAPAGAQCPYPNPDDAVLARMWRSGWCKATAERLEGSPSYQRFLAAGGTPDPDGLTAFFQRGGHTAEEPDQDDEEETDDGV